MTAVELHDKFRQTGEGFTLTYGGLSTFFGGLERLVGAPDPKLDKMMRQTASLTGRAWDGWRQEQLAWLFSPHQPSYYAKSG